MPKTSVSVPINFEVPTSAFARAKRLQISGYFGVKIDDERAQVTLAGLIGGTMHSRFDFERREDVIHFHTWTLNPEARPVLADRLRDGRRSPHDYFADHTRDDLRLLFPS